jgi:hypothetical protein
MVPKPFEVRLFTNMETMETNWETWRPAAGLLVCGTPKESKLKLSLETRNRGDVIIVHCHGRIVYRDEAAALSRLVGDILKEEANWCSN